MNQSHRSAVGGLFEREHRLLFTFDGVAYEGYQGDTLASALLANGVSTLGRSFKYHRRRGIIGIGAEEPNALVTVRSRDRHEPNLRATEVELYEGLQASSQNRWPSLNFDIGSINSVFGRFLPAGFYYKTFMWPASWWLRYEAVIRKAAGLGEAPRLPDPDSYSKRHAHCDVLVIGAGPAGLVAALDAALSGARVMLVDDHAHVGGRLRYEEHLIDGASGDQWAAQMAERLRSMSNVRLLTRASAFGYYDDNLIAVCEHVADHCAQPEPHQPRQRIWWIRTQQVILASGAIERPVVFPGNDIPGVMLASAASGYAHCHAVQAGRKAVLFTNNDEAYASASVLHRGGVHVRAIVDSRAGGGGESARAIAIAVGAQIINGAVITKTHGRKRVKGVSVRAIDGVHNARALDCDLLCMSGGWSPTVHLFSQALGRLRFDHELVGFVPDSVAHPLRCCGAANGVAQLSSCLADGKRVAAETITALGMEPVSARASVLEADIELKAIQALWEIPPSYGSQAKSFVDFQNDVTADDVRLAARENYRSVEHLKRYTTMGMGTDQGRTSNVNALAIMAQSLSCEIEQVGTTTFRPPYSPVTISALGGLEVGDDYMPVRRTPLHDWHVRAGATMQNVGLWQRARHYPRAHESMADAVCREVLHVRNKVGVVDVSTFGKIDLRGADAAQFLERVTINRFHNLKLGRCRYHVMLREDGFVMDDGTTTRVGEDAFYMTTTTAAAAAVLSHFEFLAQTVWPQLQVQLTDVSDQWGGFALAGPQAREVLATVCDQDVSHAQFGFMACIDATIAGIAVRVFRITFSGELGYEVHVAADYLSTVWQAVLEAGRAFDLQPYGTEAMGVMRIEKGHVVHAELDGRAIPSDFGFDSMIRKTGDFVGREALQREAFARQHRPTLVGLVSDNGKPIAAGAHLVWNPTTATPMQTYGHVTSACYSPTLDAHIALALVSQAEQWLGKILYAAAPLQGFSTPVRIVDSVFVDRQGRRARG
jgi:heterotetrameric sarcosine oxidase alpha subunit